MQEREFSNDKPSENTGLIFQQNVFSEIPDCFNKESEPNVPQKVEETEPDFSQHNDGYYEEGVHSRDFNHLFKQGREYQDDRESAVKRKKIILTSFLVFLAVAFFIVSRIYFGKLFIQDSTPEREPPIVIYYPESTEDLPRTPSGEDTSYYIISELNDVKYPEDKIEINNTLITYVEPSLRTLYFRVKPKTDDLAIYIKLSVYDENGKEIYQFNDSLYGIGAGEDGIIPVPLGISSSKKDIHFSVEFTNTHIVTPNTQKEITSIKEEKGHIYLTVKCEHVAILVRDVYIVFYKDGKFVDLLAAKSTKNYQSGSVEIDFDVRDIDYDTYEIYQ